MTLEEFESALVNLLLEAGKASCPTRGDVVGDPGYVVRCLILDAVKDFWNVHHKPPECIHLSPPLEALLQAHARGLDLRKDHILFGLPLQLDAPCFRLA